MRTADIHRIYHYKLALVKNEVFGLPSTNSDDFVGTMANSSWVKESSDLRESQSSFACQMSLFVRIMSPLGSTS